ncbi:MAG: HigA family addiction module antidote protein [Holophagae bacterium]|nr:HigA family addiction module antidote protein [Holophagae bacterium]
MPTRSRSLTTTSRREGSGEATLAPVHPGEVLLEEFLVPLGLSQYRVARDTSVPPRRINEIVHGTRAVTADTALRLARYFGTSDRFWLNLQARYDLEVEKARLGDRLLREVTVLGKAG